MIGEEEEKLDPGHRHFQDDYPASAQTWPQASIWSPAVY